MNILRLMVFLMTACTPKDVADPDEFFDDTGSGGGGGEVEAVWTDLRHQTAETFNDAYTDGLGLWVISTSGQTWHLQDEEWSNVPIDVDEEDLNGLWGSGAAATLKMFAVGNAGTVAAWDGARWVVESEGTANFLSIDGPSVNNLIAVGGNGASMNTGAGWDPQSVDGAKFDDVWFDGTSAFAVGSNGTIGTMSEGEWTVENAGVELDLHGVSATNPSDVWAVGEQGTVLHYNGEIWQQIDIDTRANMWSVWSPVGVGNVAYVVGANGLAYRIQGNIVEKLPTGIDNTLYAVTGTTEANVWAVGSKGIAINLIVED